MSCSSSSSFTTAYSPIPRSPPSIPSRDFSPPPPPPLPLHTTTSSSSSTNMQQKSMQPMQHKRTERDERIVFLESIIIEKDSNLCILTHEKHLLSSRRRALLSKVEESMEDTELVKGIVEEIATKKMTKDKLMEVILVHEEELRKLRLEDAKEVAEEKPAASSSENVPAAVSASAVAGRFSPQNELARLLGIRELDEHSSNALLMQTSVVEKLKMGFYSESEARILYKTLQFIVTVRTARTIASRSGYIFRELIIPLSSQPKTILQYVFFDRVYCAKISYSRTITHEFNTMKIIHKKHSYCPTVIKAVDMFQLNIEEVDEAMCMILPYYPKSVADIFISINFDLPDKFVIHVALCGLATIKAMNAVGFCHGDIKPSNMMIDCSSDFIVTIDFGASSPYDYQPIEFSKFYPMDVRGLSIEYDLTCLCSSILQLKNNSIFDMTTRDEARAKFSGNSSLPYVVAMLCLNHTNVDDIINEIVAIDGSYSSYIEMIMPKIDL